MYIIYICSKMDNNHNNQVKLIITVMQNPEIYMIFRIKLKFCFDFK